MRINVVHVCYKYHMDVFTLYVEVTYRLERESSVHMYFEGTKIIDCGSTLPGLRYVNVD